MQEPLFVGGVFIPYFFEIRLKTKDNLRSLFTLPLEVQRSYYHEWWHYLQNTTTTFGVMGTWHVYDWLRQMVYFIQNAPDGLTLPLDRSQQTNLRQVQSFLNLQSGDGQITTPFPSSEYEVANISIVQHDLIDTILPNVDIGVISLSLRHKSGATFNYDFGRTAIAECMALMAEELHYGKDPQMPRYPYRVAYDIAVLEYPPIADGGELLFSLCDTALMHPLPGWAFYNLLQEMKKDSFQPTTGENVIDYGMKKYAEWGWNIEKQRNDAITGLQKVIDDLFQNRHDEATLYWLKSIMIKGHNLRETNPYFALELFRDKPFGPKMTKIWLEVGGPHCINENHERYIQLPEDLQQQYPNLADGIFPQKLRIIQQFIQLLTIGKVECGLYNICDNSIPPTVDNRCKTTPWERANDQYGCPYAAAWVNWGFHNRTWYINGQLIKT